ncbi:MAG: M15 family metallopeptidase [Bacillota bacterium]|jgi:D-alanyl-D-alanine dipeptidase
MRRVLVLVILMAMTVVPAEQMPPGVREATREEVEAELDALRAENAQLRSALRAVLEASDLVRVEDIDSAIVLDLRYATKNNLTGRAVYPAHVALLRRETARKLAAANAELIEQGYRIKLWDAYRPYHLHVQLWQAAGDKRHFFADPRYGSVHNRGAAVDVTLVDAQGREVEMPSDFDDFSGAGHRRAPMSQAARANLDLLTEVMHRHGFVSIDFEWWHFEDSTWWRYPIIDVPLELYDIITGGD